MLSHKIISQMNKEAVLNILYDNFQEEISLGTLSKLSVGSDGDRCPFRQGSWFCPLLQL